MRRFWVVVGLVIRVWRKQVWTRFHREMRLLAATDGTIMNRLIIAEDNSDLARVLATMSERLGWSVQVTGDGDEFLRALAQQTTPALALIDINMPQRDGIDVINGIVETNRPLRLRFMTGGEISSILAARMIASARGLSVGRNVHKPISLEDLRKVLSEEEKELEALCQTEDIDAATSK
jgi:CheY-like chemotaxis protein